MSVEERKAPDAEMAGEIERLRARVTQLEAELVEVEAWANQAVAAAQQRTYWLDRYHVDLNRLMERPGAAEFRALLAAARAVYRALRRLQRRIHP